MNKSWFYLGAISIVATLLTSCGESAKPPAPAATPAPVAATPPAVAPPTVPATPIAAATPTPTASSVKSVGIKPVSVDVAAGLIAPTDGDNWAKTVSKGRADPFAMIALQPIEVAEIKDPFNPTVTPPAKSQIASNPQPKQAVTNNSSPTKVSGKQKIASNGNTATTGSSARSGTVSISSIPRTGINRALPKIIVAISAAKSVKSTTTAESGNNTKAVKAAMVPKSRNNNSIPAIKPVQAPSVVAFKPEKVAEKPLQAIALEISGVIEVAGTTQVIVKLPTESFSRYIEVGNRVADGKVLIKRVEGQNSLSPTVVLEEVGVEVPRKIGDKSPAPEVPVAAPPLRTP